MGVRESVVQQSQEFPPTDPEAGHGPLNPEMLSREIYRRDRSIRSSQPPEKSLSQPQHPWTREEFLKIWMTSDSFHNLLKNADERVRPHGGRDNSTGYMGRCCSILNRLRYNRKTLKTKKVAHWYGWNFDKTRISGWKNRIVSLR
ncbi:UNVERIFIED_CONTAM: hypothetical protein PYX00_003739 [Menopon gallinae]|uniref:Uncharacterized protein n=1 Tax=Menopon gallinae TaxID=328185 RepID=A0AAW2I1M5_9NEOP